MTRETSIRIVGSGRAVAARADRRSIPSKYCESDLFIVVTDVGSAENVASDVFNHRFVIAASLVFGEMNVKVDVNSGFRVRAAK